ncbi:MAG: hypothetical protein MHPSP_004085, partial [Paramarteilia canceri]
MLENFDCSQLLSQLTDVLTTLLIEKLDLDKHLEQIDQQNYLKSQPISGWQRSLETLSAPSIVAIGSQ